MFIHCESAKSKVIGNLRKLALSIAALLVMASASDLSAQESEDYDQPTVEHIIANEITPLAESLSELLMKISPRKDGQVFPILVQFVPFVPIDPDNVRRVTYHCPWGGATCEPFLQACIALLESCTCSDYGSIEPDPC